MDQRSTLLPQISLKLFPRGSRLQPSLRTLVTSNHNLCNFLSLLPCRGSPSLCYIPLKTNLGHGPCPKGPALRALRVAELSSQHPSSFSSQCYQHLGQKLWLGPCLVPYNHSHPCSPTHWPLTGGAVVRRTAPAALCYPQELVQAITHC